MKVKDKKLKVMVDVSAKDVPPKNVTGRKEPAIQSGTWVHDTPKCTRED